MCCTCNCPVPPPFVPLSKPLPPRVICSVRVVNTILPTPKVKSPSPIKVPVISLSPLKALPPLSPPRPAASDVKAAEESGVGSQSPTPNGLPSSDGPRETTPKTRSPRTPKTPLPPLSAELSLNPMDYLYVVELIESPEVKLQVPAKQLRYASQGSMLHCMAWCTYWILYHLPFIPQSYQRDAYSSQAQIVSTERSRSPLRETPPDRDGNFVFVHNSH